MDRKDYYFAQPVTEADLDGAFDGAERADRAVVRDAGLVGIQSGGTVTQNATPSLSVLVAALFGYDADGQRVATAAQQAVSLVTDTNGVSTSVASSGKAKVVSLFVQFDRVLSDPRNDGNSQSVYFDRKEGSRFIIRQGAEANVGLQTAPALEADKILLADVLRTFGQTTILDADIDITRRQDMFTGLDGRVQLRVGTIKAALEELRQHAIDQIINVATLSGSYNDYDPVLGVKTNTLRVALNGATTFTGLKAPTRPGQRIRVMNVSTNSAYTLTLTHQSGLSVSANRWYGPNNADHVIRAGGSTTVWYDNTSGLWRIEAP